MLFFQMLHIHGPKKCITEMPNQIVTITGLYITSSPHHIPTPWTRTFPAAGAAGIAAPTPVVPASFTVCEEKPQPNFFDEVKKDIARLLADKYHEAVREGRPAEAKALAEKALEFDPSCFDQDR